MPYPSLRPHFLELGAKLIRDVVDHLIHLPVPILHSTGPFGDALTCLLLALRKIPAVIRRTCHVAVRVRLVQLGIPVWVYRRAVQQILKITSDSYQDELERLEGVPHIAAAEPVHVHEGIDLTVDKEVVQVSIERQLGIKDTLDSRNSVFVQMYVVPHGTGELPDITERVIVTRGGDEERAGLRLPGRLQEVGEEGRLWEGGRVRWSDDPAEW